MTLFNKETVTVIRKVSGGYEDERIVTTKVLAGSEISNEQNRINTINRLRNNPNVVLVLYGKDGKCEEHAVLASGFEMNVSINEGDETNASIVVMHSGNLAYKQDFAISDEASDYDSSYRFLLDEIIWILESIDNADYSFVNNNCPGFEEVDAEQSLDLFEIEEILKKNGYQCETIHALGWIRKPIMFIDENEVVLVGSHVYDKDCFFIELKRSFRDIPKSDVEKALDMVGKECSIDVLSCEDGTWSFRSEMDNIYSEQQILKVMHETINKLKNHIKRIESQIDIYETDSYEMERIRQFYIYETLATSIQLSRLHI